MSTRSSYYTTNDVNLASALLALGIPTAENEPFTIHRSLTSDKSIYTFYFEAISKCGKYKTSDVLKIWNDPSLYDDSESPVAFMRCLVHNKNGLLDVINKSDEMITIEKNGKTMVVSKSSSKEFKQNLLNLL